MRCFISGNYACARIALLTIAVLSMYSRTLNASWAYVPQEVRMAEADLIVAGKIEKLGEDVEKNGTVYEVGIVKPSRVLKGKPKMTDDIRLAWPKRALGGLRLSTDLPTPKVGEASIWVMRADEELPVYWATYPTDRQPLDKLDDMQKKMETLKKIQWSKPNKGLQVGVFVEQRDMRQSKVRVKGKPARVLAQMSAYALFKNAADQSVHLVNYPYDDPFTIELTDPEGEPMQVQTAISAPRKPPLQKHNFVKMGPGRIRTMGYGYQLGMATKPGDYKVKLKYKNSHDGDAFGFENVWKGEAITPEVSFHVAE